MATTDIEALVLTYASAWCERDPVHRRALVERCWSPSGEIFGPNVHVVGREALLAEIMTFHRQRPSDRAIITSGLDCHHRFARFAVAVLNAEGSVIATGFDIAEVGPDGLLARILTFWGEPPEVPATWPAELLR